MKKLFFTFLISLSLTSFGQVPQEISYQGVARNASGSLLSNQNIGIKLDLHQGSAGGAVVFSETHSKTTNSFGLFTLGIGSVNTAAFTAINWANGPYFMEVSMDPAGGSSYTSVGTQQFMSVPYALYAKTAGNVSPTPTIAINAPNTVTSAGGGYTINIPASATYSAGTGINVSGNTISNTAPDQTVVLNAAGATTVTGTYPNFTINTPTSQTYSAGNGIDITGGVISNTAAAVTPTIVGTGATTVTGTYPNLTIASPTTQAYSAGNGIDITGGIISNTAAAVTPTIVGTGATTVTGTYPNLTINTPTVAPDQVVSLTGTGTATVTGAYPSFTVNVPSGSSLPTGFNGQFLFNNGTIWDTLPRPNLFFDGTNFGVGTTAPQATFHVVGAGRFDASVSTPQIYTDNIKITGGNAGQVLTSDAIGNGTWQAIPSPTLTYNNGTNVLTLTQGTIVTTATLVGTGSNTVSIVGSGLATVTPTTGSTFTVSVPNPTLTITSGSLSISNGNSVAFPSPSLTINSNSLTINGPGGNTVVLPTASTTSLTQGSNITVSGSAPNYTVSAPAYSISLPGGNTVQLTNGVSTSTAAINATSLTLTGAGNNILSAGGNTVALNTYTAGSGITVSGTAPNYTLSSPNQSLTINSNSLSITGGNTITLPTSSTTTLTQGAGVTVAGSAPSYTISSASQSLAVSGNSLSITGANTVTIPTSSVVAGNTNITIATSGNTYSVSAVTPTLNVVGGALAGIYPSQTLTIPTSSTTAITASTGITVTGAAPNYTLSSPNQSLSVTGNSLSITGANTVTIPTTSVVAGNANIIVNQSGNTFSVSSVASPLSLTGTTLTSGPATNSVNLAPLSVWSRSATSVFPSTLTDKVGIGTNAPAFKLDVTGNGRFTTGIQSNGQVYIANSGNYQSFAVSEFGGLGAGINLQATGVGGRSYTMYSENGSGLLQIFDETASAVRMVINQYGRVGLGSISPNQRLDVRGNIGLDSSLLWQGLNSMPQTSSGGNGRIYFDRTSQKFKVSENGGAYVDMISGAGSSPWLQGAGIITQNNPGDMVGIGTVAPSSPLHVYGISDPLQITVENGGGNFATGYHIKTGLGQEWFMGQDGSSSTGFRITDKDAFAVRFQIDQDGRTGIGTTSASEKLDVNGNVKLDSSLMVTGLTSVPPTSNGGNGRIYFDQVSGKFKVSENSGPYVDMIGGGTSPWIQGAGMITQMNLGDLVGIGTSLPEYRLDVRNSSDVLINLSSSASTQGTQAGLRLSMFDGYVGKQYTLAAEKTDATVNSGASDFVIKSHYSTAGGTLNNMVIKGQDLIFNESKTTGFDFGNVIVASGYLGVGTGSPSAKLDVNGNIKADSSLMLSGMGTVPPISFGGSGRIFFDQISGKFKVSENGGGYVDLISSTGSDWGLSGNALTGTEFLGSTNAQDVVFKSAGTELMRLLSNNSITFTAGQYSMTASTAVNPALTITGANFRSTQLNMKTTAAVTGVGNLGSISFSDGTNSTTQAYIQGQREAASGGASDLPTALLFFTTADGSGTEGERMRINNAGKVGIGTQVPSAMLHALNAANTGSSGRFENNSTTNTADAVFVQNSGTGAGVHIVATATSTLGLLLENAHMKSTASVSPGTSTVSVSGINTIALTPTGCTDVKGNILAVVTHSGNIAINNSVTYRVTFAKPYQISPTVILTPTTDFGIMSYYISAISSTSFNVTIRCTSNTGETRTNFGLNYWVIE
ncbi:MAG: hypothetical protein K0S53_172 [Bacteroidetes bacterium]|jgi:hypothetical protein|nr:hypothetical protein [Bacteroidota bacterium]